MAAPPWTLWPSMFWFGACPPAGLQQCAGGSYRRPCGDRSYSTTEWWRRAAVQARPQTIARSGKIRRPLALAQAEAVAAKTNRLSDCCSTRSRRTQSIKRSTATKRPKPRTASTPSWSTRMLRDNARGHRRGQRGLTHRSSRPVSSLALKTLRRNQEACRPAQNSAPDIQARAQNTNVCQR